MVLKWFKQSKVIREPKLVENRHLLSDNLGEKTGLRAVLFDLIRWQRMLNWSDGFNMTSRLMSNKIKICYLLLIVE